MLYVALQAVRVCNKPPSRKEGLDTITGALVAAVRFIKPLGRKL